MTWHKLKTWPPYFEAMLKGEKDFELRTNDRNFKVGDYLILQEWNPITYLYSGRYLVRIVTYILEGAFGLPEDKVIMQLRKV